MNASLQRGLERLRELGGPERTLESRGDDTPAVDREQPRLRAQVERLELWTEPLAGLVLHVYLLVDERDLVAEPVLELDGHIGHGPADARDAEPGSREQQRDRALAEHLVERHGVHLLGRL